MKINRFLATAVAVAAPFVSASSATAGAIVNSQNFNVNVNSLATVPGSPSVVNGSFSGATNTAFSFGQFDAMGGTRILNSVLISIAASTPTLAALVSSDNCIACSASATNVTVFSAAIDAPGGSATDFALTPLTQSLTGPTASGNCPDDLSCTGFSNNPSQMLALLALAFNSVPADLSSFIGSGTILVTPVATLAGTYTVNNDNSTDVDNSTTVSSTTFWNGSISVTYNYTDATPSVPEPASLALVGVALIALGGALLRRRSVK